MKKIIDLIYEEKNGHYCHCVEVTSVYDLENIAENIANEYKNKYSESEIIDFLETMEVYYIGHDKEEESLVYDFSFRQYIEGTID
jgi:hypothetical protein